MAHVAVAEVESLSTATKLDYSVLAGATMITLRSVPDPGWIASKPYVVVDPYTSYCEVRRVSSSDEDEVTLSSALTYAHRPGTRVLWRRESALTPELFGAVGNGTTDDTGAINRGTAATNAAGYGSTRPGKMVLWLDPAKTYLITAPINLCEMQGVMLDGGAPNFGATILGQTNGAAMIEIIGSQDITVRNVNIYGSSTLTPAVGIFTSRSNTVHGANSANISYTNVQFGGYFTQTPIYIVESESNYFHHVNTAATAGTMTTCALLCSHNELSLTPVHATLGDHGYGLSNINFDRCLITNAGGVRAIHIVDGAGDVHIHDSYLYSTTVPTIEIEGGATLYCSHVGCEGTPNYTIYLNYDAGAYTNSYYLHLDSFGFGSPTSHSLYADDGTTVKNSSVRTSPPGISGGAAMPVRFWKTEECDFAGFADYRSGEFAIVFDGATGYSAHCKYRLELADTLTFSGGATSNGDTIEDVSVVSSELLQIPALKIASSYNAANATIKIIRTATKVWDVGSLADGETASTYIEIPDITADGNWIAWASLDSLDEYGWQISATPHDTGSAYVNVTNHSGGVIDPPSGTLRVVAMKVA